MGRRGLGWGGGVWRATTIVSTAAGRGQLADRLTTGTRVRRAEFDLPSEELVLIADIGNSVMTVRESSQFTFEPTMAITHSTFTAPARNKTWDQVSSSGHGLCHRTFRRNPCPLLRVCVLVCLTGVWARNLKQLTFTFHARRMYLATLFNNLLPVFFITSVGVFSFYLPRAVSSASQTIITTTAFLAAMAFSVTLQVRQRGVGTPRGCWPCRSCASAMPLTLRARDTCAHLRSQRCQRCGT